jgi:ABC-type transport system substrate-binding protein
MVTKISGRFATQAASNIGPGDWAYDSTIAPIPFDLGRSRALLARAGWRPSPSGILEREGKPLELDLYYQAGSHSYAAYALEIQAMLRTAGIDIELKPTALSVLAAPEGTKRSGAFDLLLLAYYGGNDPSDLSNFTCAAIPPNGANTSRWCDREYDRVTSDALSRSDREARRRDYRRASQILVEQVPEIFIYVPKILELTRRGVHIDDAPDDVWAPYLWSKE